MSVPLSRFFVAVAPFGNKGPIGNVWRFTGKKSDFYLDLGDGEEGFHLSAHGPNAEYSGLRFHLKVNTKVAATAHERGGFAMHGVPRKGRSINVHEVSPNAYHVATVRWSSDILRRRYRKFAISSHLPEATSERPGRLMNKPVGTGEAVDLEIFVSLGTPYIHGGRRAERDKAVMGPIGNEAGMWLSATFTRRLERDHPTPESLVVPKPGRKDEPNRILAGGPSMNRDAGPYWFVESITSRAAIEAAQKQWLMELGERRTSTLSHDYSTE